MVLGEEFFRVELFPKDVAVGQLPQLTTLRGKGVSVRGDMTRGAPEAPRAPVPELLVS